MTTSIRFLFLNTGTARDVGGNGNSNASARRDVVGGRWLVGATLRQAGRELLRAGSLSAGSERDLPKCQATMTAAEFRRVALSFEGAEEGSHMGAQLISASAGASSPRWRRLGRALET
jgi:hypothetical protein